jgi:CheY-like chemotaxis protein
LVKPIKQSDLLEAVAKAVGLAPRGGQEPEQFAPTTIHGSRLRILLAEDNLASQLIGQKALEKIGHSVHVASNGKQVLQMLDGDRFDLIVMNVEMPEMDGLEATRIIREREAHTGQHIPILAITSYATKEDHDRCLAAGMDGYLPKPFSPERLSSAIEHFMLPMPVSDAESPLDMDTALQVVGGDRELLRQAVSLFVEHDCPRYLQEMKDAIARQDAQAAKKAAHGLKGVLISLGSRSAHDVALHIETMGRDGDLGDAKVALEQLAAEVKRFAAYFAMPTSG